MSFSNARQRRHDAARLFAEAPQRERLGWDDLADLPDWAVWERDKLDRLAFACGTRAHGASLARCIDARVWKRLRKTLGNEPLAMLLSEDTEEGAAPLLDPADVDPDAMERLIGDTGRDWLLASVASPRLRDALRELLWPESGPALRAVNFAAATAAVQAACKALQEETTAEAGNALPSAQLAGAAANAGEGSRAQP